MDSFSMGGLGQMIPIKGYATFDPLKHCWIGSGFKAEMFQGLQIYNNNKIMDPIKRIAEETEEDYQTLEKILKDAGVITHRSFLNMEKIGSLENIPRPPIAPRDHFAVLGEKFYAVTGGIPGHVDVLKKIDRKNMEIADVPGGTISTATMTRVGKDVYWDVHKGLPQEIVQKYVDKWTEEGFRVHTSNRNYHNDGAFCVVKPGLIVSLMDVQDYKKEFPGWEVMNIPETTPWLTSGFHEMKHRVGGKWWLKGEEQNDQLIDFVNTWLNDWVGYVEETVFDVNMLSIDQNTIICNNYNKQVFDAFKKHKVEPIIFNFRHGFFWDSGVHCITQDLYREGTMQDYFS